MTILAIDIGTHLGWFRGAAVGPCEWGTFELENTTNLGRWLASANPFLTKHLKGVSAIAVEKPNAGAGSSFFAVRKNMALLGLIHFYAHYEGIASIEEISVSTGKLTLAGHGHADKEMMIAAAAADGYEGLDDHAADAYGIWKVAVFGARERNRPKARSSKGVSLLRGPAR